MTRPAHESWPPLITAASQPRWMLWRDRLLTVLMWLVLFGILETEMELVFSHLRKFLGRAPVAQSAHFDVFLRRLEPFGIMIAVLASLLFGSALATRRRWFAGLAAQAPSHVPLGQLAAPSGMTAEELHAAQSMRMAVAHIEEGGRVRITPRQVAPLP